jgi:hypothetical protein
MVRFTGVVTGVLTDVVTGVVTDLGQISARSRRELG